MQGYDAEELAAQLASENSRENIEKRRRRHHGCGVLSDQLGRAGIPRYARYV